MTSINDLAEATRTEDDTPTRPLLVIKAFGNFDHQGPRLSLPNRTGTDGVDTYAGDQLTSPTENTSGVVTAMHLVTSGTIERDRIVTHRGFVQE
ncbi:hypothetical protein [Kutzneria buriramensis]|uniref:hypothetical protein n=1 Tax=Kutzneria buriramensis TaxID=1045776 RepID=UPI0011C0D9AD